MSFSESIISIELPLVVYSKVQLPGTWNVYCKKTYIWNIERQNEIYSDVTLSYNLACWFLVFNYTLYINSRIYLQPNIFVIRSSLYCHTKRMLHNGALWYQFKFFSNSTLDCNFGCQNKIIYSFFFTRGKIKVTSPW